MSFFFSLFLVLQASIAVVGFFFLVGVFFFLFWVMSVMHGGKQRRAREAESEKRDGEKKDKLTGTKCRPPIPDLLVRRPPQFFSTSSFPLSLFPFSSF